MPLPLALAGQTTTDVVGAVGMVTGPTGMVLAIPGTTVRAGKSMLPVATMDSPIAPHGNYYNPQAPGYNPECADAVIDGPAPSASSVIVCGRPIAPSTSVCSCTHQVLFGIEPTVIVGR
jgi:hypothetical protein